MTMGVAQGLIIAAFYFLVYVKDLLETCKSSIPLLCAADAKFISINNWNLKFQIELSRVLKWSEPHRLSLNFNKWENNSNNLQENNFCFDGKGIIKSYSNNNFGIFICNDLKWNEKCNYLSTHAMKLF